MPDTCVFLLSYTLHELGGGGGGGLWQPVLLYGSLKGQSHINIYICVVNYAQMRFPSASLLRCEICSLFYLSTGSQLMTKRIIP